MHFPRREIHFETFLLDDCLALFMQAITSSRSSEQELVRVSPRLSELLKLVAGRVPLLLEVKNEGHPGSLEEEIARLLSEYSGPVALQSFNPLSLRMLRRLCPERPRGLLADRYRPEDAPVGPLRRWLLRHLLLARLCEPDFVAYRLEDLSSSPIGLSRLRRAGCPLLLWTIRDPQARALAIEVGDNYIFEGRGTPKLS